MKAIPLSAGFGAELRGVTLADVASDDDAYTAVRTAFEQHSVLILRGQEVSDELQLAFSRRFGPPEVTKVGSHGTGTHFVILTTIGSDGKVVPADHRMQMRNKANQLWHTDSSFKHVPALASILSARIIPEHGGETNTSRPVSPSSGSIRRCSGNWKSPLPGTITRIRVARSLRVLRPMKSARRCLRNAGAWCGATPRTDAARCTSHPTPMRSKPWTLWLASA